MRHELYETLYIYNSFYRIGKRIQGNSVFQEFLMIFIIGFILALCYFLIPFFALYLFWTTDPKIANKEEYMDNITFFKILIPIILCIALLILIFIKTITLLQAVFIAIGLFDLCFIFWIFEDRIIKFFKLL